MITLANPQINTASIPTLTQGGAVKIQLSGSGGTMPYSFSGSMPAGLTMSSTGLISGAPTASGVFSYILTIKDAKSIANSVAVKFIINPPPKVTTTALAQGKEGTAYSQTITISGGVAPYTFSSTSSVAGLALSAAGTLAGTPSKAGVTQYVINVKDANGVLGTVTLPLTITAKATTVKPAVLSFITGLQTGQLTVSISTFTSTIPASTTGYRITETASVPTASSSGWSTTAPTSYKFQIGTSSGIKTLYAWVKDAAGNVSAATVKTIVIDTVAPTITAFSTPQKVTSLKIPISQFTATDNIGVAGYLVTLSPYAPSATDPGWTAKPPTDITVSPNLIVWLYGWVKDSAGNVSMSRMSFSFIVKP
jgi:hypothetical protein